MTSKIILKKSSVVGKTPLTGDLAYGELALNYADGKLFYKSSNNTIEYLANGGTFTNALAITSSTQSSSTSTGALTVTGGVGIGGNLNVAGSLIVQGIDLLSYDGDIYYVSASGNDSNDGYRPQSARQTIKSALSSATTGDKVFVEPGDYYEILPLEIPQGVSLMGAGLRTVTVYPTTATNTQTVFLLNGESYLADLTIRGFYKPGYAFRFKTGAKITIRSPYIERVTVLSQGSVTGPNDPYGFDAADAGNGAYLDASVLDSTSLEPTMLWNEVTFIVPNATGFYMTNGARAELLNGFVYFADKAIEAVSGTTGYGGVGKTKLRLEGVIGNLTPGDTIFYADSTGTILASGLIQSTASGGYVFIDGPAWGFESITDRPGKEVFAFNGAIQSTAQKKFGTSSALFNGSSSYLQVPTNNDFSYGTGDFTIEFWIRANSTSTQYLWDQRSSSGTVIPGIYLSNTLRYATAGVDRITGTTAVTTGTWNHVAVSRASGDIRLFLNGVQEGTTYNDTSTYAQSEVKIGIEFDNTDAYNGYIDEVRVSKGVARYTSTFTVATAAFIADSNTVLLLHLDGGNNSTTIIDDAVGVQNVYTTGTNTGTATRIVLADYHQFGAELRCIGSAAVFGNQGVIANGTGTDLKLIAFNVSHIGAGKDLSNDASLVVQSNEIIQLNNGKIYYQTVDQNGDFRVGNSFLINQRTGNVSFGDSTVNLSNLASLTISDGVNSTIINPGDIVVGQLNLASSTLGSLSGNITISPAGTVTIVDSDLQVNGTITSNGNTVLTTASGYVNYIIAGTDTAVSTSGSVVSIWNTGTLQSVTDRGATTTNVINITNTTSATNSTSGALVVSGGVGISGDLFVGGNITAQSLTVQYTTVTTTIITTDDVITTTNSTESTSTNSGALLVTGGVGVGGNINVGGSVNNITITKPATSATLTINDGKTITFPQSLSFPSVNGTSTYVLSTDGSGNLDWVAPDSGPTGPTGPQGDTGIIISPTAPVNTATLWLDQSDPNGIGVIGIPNSGTTNQVLIKLSNTDYDVAWANNVPDLTSVSQSIIPSANNTYDLGSTSSQWRDIYVSTGSIYIGDIKLSNSSGKFTVEQVTNPGTPGEVIVPGSTPLLPADATGYLYNDGTGVLTWIPSVGSLTIVNTLTSTSTSTALSASMGKELQDTKQKNITYGTSPPTGGVDGDIYLQYT